MMPGETDYGKGSFPRTWNTDAFRENHAAIDWKRQSCPVCLEPKPCRFEQFYRQPHTHTPNPKV